MELDDLKDKWQKETTIHSQLNTKSMEQVQIILHGKTTDLITSMKKKYEKIISIMLGGMLLAILFHPIITDGFTYPGSVNGFVKMMFFYLIILIFYWEKLKSINHIKLSDGLKERMEQLLKMLQKNLRIEVSFVVLFFIAILVIGRFVYGKGLQDLDDRGVVIGFPLAILVTGSMIYFIISRYKKQILELKEYLSEYENMD
jgi:hypothetical protein